MALSPLQDAWGILKEEPVEKGIFDRFRRTPEEPQEVEPEPQPEPEPEPGPGLDESVKNRYGRVVGEGDQPKYCQRCTELERELRSARGTNDALHSKLQNLSMDVDRLKTRRDKIR